MFANAGKKFRPFSERQKSAVDRLRADLTDEVRNRLLYTMQDLIDPGSPVGNIGQYSGFGSFLGEVETRLRHQYGGLILGGKKKPRSSTPSPAIDFFLDCVEERALSFIEFFFQSQWYRQRQRGVDRINDILREEGLMYEFSPFSDHTDAIPPPAHFPSGSTSIWYTIDHYPEAIIKTDELVHDQVVAPALQLLVGVEWKSANDHLLKSHEYYRKSEFRYSITECNSALESTLKIICQKKGWTYTPDKDVLSGLIEVINRNGLVFPFYAEVLKNCGTIRNKLGAHGQEPTPSFKAEAVHAEHMLHLVSSHILMLTRLAGYR